MISGLNYNRLLSRNPFKMLTALQLEQPIYDHDDCLGGCICEFVKAARHAK